MKQSTLQARLVRALGTAWVLAALTAPAFAACGDGALDPGEDCEAPFGPCCDPETCVFAANTMVCRPSGGECDVEERCYLLSDQCPPDTKAAAGTECTDTTANDCKNAQCDGAGSCDQNFGNQTAGATCDSTLDTCGVADTCNGSGTCRNVGGDLAPGGDGDDDGDAVCDADDTCPHEAINDSDHDGACAGGPSGYDNCPALANADQADADHDGVGDACDPCTDTDGDGIRNPGYAASTCGGSADDCPSVAAAAQTDSDGDGVGDVCDNCPSLANAGQSDIDADGAGDACDADDAPGSLLIGRVELTTDSAGSGSSGAVEISALLSDTTQGELYSSLVANEVQLEVSDSGGQFALTLANHAAVALAGCTASSPAKVKCASPDGTVSASFTAKAPDVFAMKLQVDALDSALTGTALPIAPITVKVHHGTPLPGSAPAVGQIDRVASISTCNGSANKLVCE